MDSIFTRIIPTIIQSPVATGIFLITIATSLAAFQNQFLKEKFILRPYAFAHRKQYFTVITSGLIHADWSHLFANMFTFFFFGFRLEHYFTRLQAVRLHDEPVVTSMTQKVAEAVGHSKFFLIYFISLVISDLTTIIKYKDIPSYASLGASGAISGLLMSCVILAPAMEEPIMIWGLLPGWLYAILYLSYSYYASQKMMDNVAHEAHLWGAISGIVFTALLMPRETWMFVETLKDTFYGWM